MMGNVHWITNNKSDNFYQSVHRPSTLHQCHRPSMPSGLPYLTNGSRKTGEIKKRMQVVDYLMYYSNKKSSSEYQQSTDNFFFLFCLSLVRKALQRSVIQEPQGPLRGTTPALPYYSYATTTNCRLIPRPKTYEYKRNNSSRKTLHSADGCSCRERDWQWSKRNLFLFVKRRTGEREDRT